MPNTSTSPAQTRQVSIRTPFGRAVHLFRLRRKKNSRSDKPSFTTSPPQPNPIHSGRAVLHVSSICRELHADGLSVRGTASSVHPSTFSPFLQLEHCGPKHLSPDNCPSTDTPRCGQQCLTYVIRGELRYRDSLGNSDVLPPGTASLLTSGSGLVVSQSLHGPVVEYISVWINSPREFKSTPPSYDTSYNPSCATVGSGDSAARIRVLAAPKRAPVVDSLSSSAEKPPTTSALQTHAGSAAVYDIRMHPKSKLVLNPQTKRVFVYVYRGSACIAQSTIIKEGQFAVLDEDPKLPLVILSGGVNAQTDPMPQSNWSDFDTFIDNSCWCVVLTGDPINEPVSMLPSGIVACTPQEIRKAFQEYTCGGLGSCSPSTVKRQHLFNVCDDVSGASSDEESDEDDANDAVASRLEFTT